MLSVQDPAHTASLYMAAECISVENSLCLPDGVCLQVYACWVACAIGVFELIEACHAKETWDYSPHLTVSAGLAPINFQQEASSLAKDHRPRCTLLAPASAAIR
jgi:hypothetical protein